MKIQVIDATTKRPLNNTKIQVQVKGKDSGFLTITTDATGNLMLEDNYTGQQITATNGGATGGQGGQWITATDGARLIVTTTGTGTGTGAGKQKETTGGGRNK